MDIILTHFLTQTYPQLAPEQQHLFQQLLAETDADILSWIMGKPVPACKALGPIITLLQQANRQLATLHAKS